MGKKLVTVFFNIKEKIKMILNFSSVSIPNFAKKFAIFSKLVYLNLLIFYPTIMYVRAGSSTMVHLNIFG